MKKIIKTKIVKEKTTIVKETICRHCLFKKSCGDLRGLCILLHYGLYALVVIILVYFFITMDL
jgi:hypothetical protein